MSKERAEEQLAAHRARLIAGLADAIREKGLANTQISDIVRHAHASRTTFYRCFEDKDACFVALAEAMFEDTRRRVADAIDITAKWEEQVDQAVDAFLTILDEDRAVTVTFSNDLPMLGARGAQLRADSNEKYGELALALVHNPVVKEQVGDVSHITIEKTIMLMSGFEGLINRAVRRGDDLRTLAPTAKDVMKRVFAPPPAKPKPRAGKRR
ncbi:MAG: TetR/AcrR family transcriptional regulator [Solirubrobacterales bacterium]